MALELASLPLALFAGMLSILSPCVWPLVPVMMSSAATSGRSGPLFLALGLSVSFAVAGTLITLLLLNAGLNPDAFRYVAAVMLLLVGVPLVYRPAGDFVTLQLSRMTSHLNLHSGTGGGSAVGQFGVGALVGLVWLPCVGPTLGAAIALASLGQDMMMAFVVMFVFGVGTASVLVVAGLVSGSVLNRVRPGVLSKGARAKQLLGWLLIVLGAMVLTGVDKVLETWALGILPDWATQI